MGNQGIDRRVDLGESLNRTEGRRGVGDDIGDVDHASCRAGSGAGTGIRGINVDMLMNRDRLEAGKARLAAGPVADGRP